MKVLSLVIPMYNTELYIERCLDSILYNTSVVDLLDIIVVDDGGSDGALTIAETYQKLYPDSVMVVKKENGGHGSAVNAGFSKARGKYFRVVDSDDWVDIDNFADYVNRLKKETADIVVTDVRRQQLYDESELNFEFEKDFKKPVSIEKVQKKILEDNFFFEFSMHSMTVRLDKLREVWGEGLLEKTFYVDQQFVAKVFMCSKNYTEYGINIYMYFIGRPEQSMGEGFFKHIDDHERVLKWLLGTLEDDAPEYYRRIVSRQVILMLGTHYGAYKAQAKLSKKDRVGLLKFDKFLRENYLKYYKLSRAPSIIRQMNRSVNNTKVGKAIKYFKKGKR